MALTSSQAKAMHTGSVSRVSRIRHGDYEVPGSLHGRTYGIRGADPLAALCDCPAGRLGRDCYHRSAVAIRITVERMLGSSLRYQRWLQWWLPPGEPPRAPPGLPPRCLGSRLLTMPPLSRHARPGTVIGYGQRETR